MIYETVCMIDTDDRYVAHVELERQWKAFDRKDRPWSYAIFKTPESMLCLMRSSQPDVGMNWRSLDCPAPGTTFSGVVMAGPKKPIMFDRFRLQSEYAKTFFQQRLQPIGQVKSLDISEAATLHINKPRQHFSMPARFAFFEVELTHPEVYASLLMSGIGGAKAFGVGTLVPQHSRLFEVVQSFAP